MRVRNLISGGITAIQKALERFPMAIIFAAATSFMTIYMTEKNRFQWEQGLSRFIGVLGLGIAVYLSIHMFLEKINKEKDKIRFAYYGGVAILLILYWQFVYVEINMVTISRHIGLILIFILGFAFIPYVKRNDNYEMYIIKVLGRMLQTIVYSIVLMIGISAILATLKYLLELNIKYEYYSYTLLLIVGVFAPSFFLGGIPRKGEFVAREKYSKALKILMLYIVMPLISIYTGILYIYFGKIIITQSWPQGLVSHLVLWYGVVGAATLFLISNLKKESKWAKLFSTVFPISILPLVVMMFISIGIRIKSYGITENRYYVVALGIWVLGTMVYLIAARKKQFIILPISLAVIMVISILGPLSSYSVAMRSQNKRFVQLLNNNNMLAYNQLVKASGEVTLADRRDMSSILHYFERNHSLSQVEYLPKDFEISNMETIFGFQDAEGYVYEANRYFYFNSQENFSAMDINGYDYMFQVVSYNSGTNIYGKGINANYKQQERKFVLYEDGNEIYSKTMDEYAKNLLEKYGDSYNGKGSVESMIFEDENEEVKVKFIFRYLSGEKFGSTEELNTVDCDFIVLVKVK